MEVGIDVGIYGALATPENVIGLAQFAESRNYHSIWLADHIVFPAKVESRYPYSPDGSFPAPDTDPILEPIATKKVKFICACYSKKIGLKTVLLLDSWSYQQFGYTNG